MIEEEGVRVDYQPPMEYKDLRAGAHEVIVQLVANGTEAMVGAAVALAVSKFRARFPNARIVIDGQAEELVVVLSGGSRPGPTSYTVEARLATPGAKYVLDDGEIYIFTDERVLTTKGPGVIAVNDSGQ